MEKRANEEKESKNTEGREMWLDQNTLKEVSSNSTSENNEEDPDEEEGKE